MFCPKCGTKNPETGKFCRACGVDLGGVSAALTSPAPSGMSALNALNCDTHGKKLREPTDVYADAIKSIVSAIGFAIIAIVLFMTNVAGGKSWWWAMLFPASALFAKGFSQLARYRAMRQDPRAAASVLMPQVGASELRAELPPSMPPMNSGRPSFDPESRYKTGDLMPPSVTEDTTRHLQFEPREK